MNLQRMISWVAVAALTGCETTPPRAPVEARTPKVEPGPVISRAPEPRPEARPEVRPEPRSDPRPEFYTVKKGDTLNGIALDHGLSYRELADLNGITDPNVIRVGQQLRVLSPRQTVAKSTPEGATVTPLEAPAGISVKAIGEPGAPANSAKLKTEPKALKLPYSEQALAALQSQAVLPRPSSEPAKPPESKPDSPEEVQWDWPTNGTLLSGFGKTSKGVDIAGKEGQPVLASAGGKVIYSGSGLASYGKLIIIKHNDIYMSVYAHNSELMVKEGQAVAKGQKIAEMGRSDADRVKLHFEIRRMGKPVDPLKYLPTEKAS